MLGQIKREPFNSLSEERKMPKLQRLVTQAFITRQGTSAGASSSGKGKNDGANTGKGKGKGKGKRPHADASDDESDKRGKKKGKRGGNGNGKNTGKGKSKPKDPVVEAAKAKLSKQQIADCYKQGKCLICQKTGHLAADCPDKTK